MVEQYTKFWIYKIWIHFKLKFQFELNIDKEHHSIYAWKLNLNLELMTRRAEIDSL